MRSESTSIAMTSGIRIGMSVEGTQQGSLETRPFPLIYRQPKTGVLHSIPCRACVIGSLQQFNVHMGGGAARWGRRPPSCSCTSQVAQTVLQVDREPVGTPFLSSACYISLIGLQRLPWCRLADGCTRLLTLSESSRRR